jgi:hypothetical protein
MMFRRVRNTAIAFAVAAVLLRVLSGLIERALPAIVGIAIVTTMLAALFPQRRSR